MNAIEWVRSKAAFKGTNRLTVPEGDEAGEYESKVYGFEGRVPARMVYQLRKESSMLVKNDKVYENIILGGKYRSDFNRVIYGRLEYTRL